MGSFAEAVFPWLACALCLHCCCQNKILLLRYPNKNGLPYGIYNYFNFEKPLNLKELGFL